MSERTDNREMGEERWTDTESREDEWDGVEDSDQLPPRPRSRFLSPLSVALIAILIAAAGFYLGVQVQKDNGGGGSAGAFPGGELPAALTGKGATEGQPEAGGFPTSAAGGSKNAVTGTVTGVRGKTIFVKEAAGNTVAVKAEDGSTVTRTATVGVNRIRPGDAVVVQGAKRGSTVKASSIAATEAGVKTNAGGFPSAAESQGEGTSVQSLFGK